MPPCLSRARYGFTFEPASKTLLKPVELSERWSVRPSRSAVASASSADICACRDGRDGADAAACTPSGPSARAYASDASSAVAYRPRFLRRPSFQMFEMNGLLRLPERQTPRKPDMDWSDLSSERPSASASRSASAASARSSSSYMSSANASARSVEVEYASSSSYTATVVVLEDAASPDASAADVGAAPSPATDAPSTVAVATGGSAAAAAAAATAAASAGLTGTAVPGDRTPLISAAIGSVGSASGSIVANLLKQSARRGVEERVRRERRERLRLAQRDLSLASSRRRAALLRRHTRT